MGTPAFDKGRLKNHLAATQIAIEGIDGEQMHHLVAICGLLDRGFAEPFVADLKRRAALLGVTTENSERWPS